MTGRPCALSDLALASTARVADSAMPPTRARVVGEDADGVLVCALTRPSSHGAATTGPTSGRRCRGARTRRRTLTGSTRRPRLAYTPSGWLTTATIWRARH